MDLVAQLTFISHSLLSVSSYGWTGEGVLWGVLYKGANPINEGPALIS